MLAQVAVLSARGETVVADVQDASSTAGSTAGDPADAAAEAALVRETAQAVATAMTLGVGRTLPVVAANPDRGLLGTERFSTLFEEP